MLRVNWLPNRVSRTNIQRRDGRRSYRPGSLKCSSPHPRCSPLTQKYIWERLKTEVSERFEYSLLHFRRTRKHRGMIVTYFELGTHIRVQRHLKIDFHIISKYFLS